MSDSKRRFRRAPTGAEVKKPAKFAVGDRVVLFGPERRKHEIIDPTPRRFDTVWTVMGVELCRDHKANDTLLWVYTLECETHDGKRVSSRLPQYRLRPEIEDGPATTVDEAIAWGLQHGQAGLQALA